MCLFVSWWGGRNEGPKRCFFPFLFAIFIVPKLQDITFNNNFGKNLECYMIFFIGFCGGKHVASLTAHIGIHTALDVF